MRKNKEKNKNKVIDFNYMKKCLYVNRLNQQIFFIKISNSDGLNGDVQNVISYIK